MGIVKLAHDVKRNNNTAEEVALRTQKRLHDDCGSALAGANARFWLEFLQRHIGFGFNICDCQWFKNNHCD